VGLADPVKSLPRPVVEIVARSRETRHRALVRRECGLVASLAAAERSGEVEAEI
jgi:hypothetical protein